MGLGKRFESNLANIGVNVRLSLLQIAEIALVQGKIVFAATFVRTLQTQSELSIWLGQRDRYSVQEAMETSLSKNPSTF